MCLHASCVRQTVFGKADPQIIPFAWLGISSLSLFLLRSSESCASPNTSVIIKRRTQPRECVHHSHIHPSTGDFMDILCLFFFIIISGICSILSDLPCFSAFCLIFQVPVNPTSRLCCRDSGLLSIAAFCINPGDPFIHSCRGCLTEDVRQILRVGSAPPPTHPDTFQPAAAMD